MRNSALILTLLAGLLISCGGPQPSTKEQPATDYQTIQADGEMEYFIVVGDWGRNGFHHQKDVADRMHEASEALDPAFIISTGDNFYDNGVASVHDPLWRTSFEDIYNGSGLLRNWYVVLGNHDYRGSVQAQLDYSNVSRRWRLPARYYTVQEGLEEDAEASFIFIDTNPFQGKYHKNPEKYDQINRQDTTAQVEWIDSVLTNSSAKWKIVIGHHPLFTSGKRAKEEQDTRIRFEGVFARYGVDAYFSGHEHDLQHHKAEGPTHYFVSGAGSEVRPLTEKVPTTLFAESRSGFMVLGLNATSMHVHAIDYTGKVLYSFRHTKKSTPPPAP
jgi:hypothetical protein